MYQYVQVLVRLVFEYELLIDNISKDSARSTGYRRILFQNGKINDGESRWRGCGSDTVPHVFFMDSRGIFQFVKKIQTKKYLFFDEKKILEKKIQKNFVIFRKFLVFLRILLRVYK